MKLSLFLNISIICLRIVFSLSLHTSLWDTVSSRRHSLVPVPYLVASVLPLCMPRGEACCSWEVCQHLFHYSPTEHAIRFSVCSYEMSDHARFARTHPEVTDSLPPLPSFGLLFVYLRWVFPEVSPNYWQLLLFQLLKPNMYTGATYLTQHVA